MKWSFKSKGLDKNLVRLADTINRINSSNIVSAIDSTYYTTPLTFYNDFKLQTFIDSSFTPYLEIHLLDNETYTFILDGTQNPFLEASTVSPLVLTRKNAYEYAMFVLRYTKKNNNSYRLVDSIEEINFDTEPTFEQYEQLEASLRTPKIKKYNDSFLIMATLLYGDSVIEASVKISLNGRVDIINEKKILCNMPVKEFEIEE